MKVCLVAHGYPPELVGGTEVSVQRLARGLAAAGDDVIVVAGSIRHEDGFRVSEERDGDVRVLRIHRADLYFEHWQKAASTRVAEAFGRILEDEGVDLVHVHHWIRLTRDLVAVAAGAGVPAVVSLHDLWTSCLVTFRVPPGTSEFCEAPLGPSPCLTCAQRVPPRTPWVSMENQFMAVAEHRADLVRELELARRVVVPTRVHGETVARFLGADPSTLGLEVVPHGRDLALGRRERTERYPHRASGRLVLGCWGHVHPLKGQDLVVDAVRRLADPTRVELHFAGGTPDEAFLRRMREETADLAVHWHGPFDLEDALASHPVTDVDAMVSGTRGHESWGLVLDEAVALGLPVLLPRAGAFPERMRAGEGALFYEPRDAASLASVLEELLANPERLGEVEAALPPVARVAPTMEEHVGAMRAVYAAAHAEGAPEAPTVDWWKAKMRAAAESEWDESLKRRSAEELGFR